MSLTDNPFEPDFSIDSDQRCRAMKQDVPFAMRCQRVKGHDGLHTFEGIHVEDPEE